MQLVFRESWQYNTIFFHGSTYDSGDIPPVLRVRSMSHIRVHDEVAADFRYRRRLHRQSRTRPDECWRCPEDVATNIQQPENQRCVIYKRRQKL